nr:putative N protein [Styphnolobium-associated cytorhabdovirus]
MAAQALTLEEALLAKYSDTPQPVLTTLRDIEYTDEKFKATPVYRLTPSTRLSNTMLNTAGTMLVNKLRAGCTDGESAYLVFLLAMNLRKTTATDELILKDLQWTDRKDLNLTDFNISWPSAQTSQAEVAPIKRVERKTQAQLYAEADMSFVEPVVDAKLAKEVRDAAIDAARAIHRRTHETAYTMELENEAKELEQAVAQSSNTSSGSSASAYFWPYFAAYLMKCMIKTAENVQLGARRMREHFLGFYPGGISEDVSLNQEAITNLALKLRSDSRILATWVGCAADFEKAEEATTQDAGMVRYLINLQFGFNGMAGYALFREVLNATRWKAGHAIMKLWMEPTPSVLDTINTILVKHESTIVNNVVTSKDTYFKYARAVNPQYFLSLQPSQCLSLIYLCAKILNHYSAYNEISNPLRLTALSKLGKEQAEYLDVFVETVLHDSDESTVGKTQLEMKAAQKYKEKKELMAATDAGDGRAIALEQIRNQAIENLMRGGSAVPK